LFRCFQEPRLRAVQAAVKLFWSCDLYPDRQWVDRVVPWVEGVVAISPSHRRHLVEEHGAPADRVQVLALGIQLRDYATEPAKVPGKLLYCSVPNPAATEQALRDVLVVNPQNAEARHNLTVFLREHGHAAVGAALA